MVERAVKGRAPVIGEPPEDGMLLIVYLIRYSVPGTSSDALTERLKELQVSVTLAVST